MRTKKILLPLYSGRLFIHQGKKLKKIENKYNLEIISDFDAFVFKTISKSGSYNYHIVFRKNPSSNTIAHEALHVMNKVFKDAYIKLDIENDEPQAYFLGWIVQQCYNFLKKIP